MSSTIRSFDTSPEKPFLTRDIDDKPVTEQDGEDDEGVGGQFVESYEGNEEYDGEYDEEDDEEYDDDEYQDYDEEDDEEYEDEEYDYEDGEFVHNDDIEEKEEYDSDVEVPPAKNAVVNRCRALSKYSIALEQSRDAGLSGVKEKKSFLVKTHQPLRKEKEISISGQRRGDYKIAQESLESTDEITPLPNIIAKSRSVNGPIKSISRSDGTVDNQKNLNFKDDDEEPDEQRNVVEWNQRFQQILGKPEDIVKYRELANLARDFSAVAQLYGKIIISEVSLPRKRKTLKPKELGGMAGGEKYIFQGILFKFALDMQHNGMWLYGGSKPNDEKAMKVACHEKKGLTCLFNCNLPGFNCPLVQLIHYRGFCLVAIALLPIRGEKTICYGSRNGGTTAYNNSKSVRKAMKYIGTILNLKKHDVTSGGEKGPVSIIGPVDFEVHVRAGMREGSEDAEYYFVDAARLFPPEAPKSKRGDEAQSIFYNLLRPELVMSNQDKVTQILRPLCSDAFSAFDKSHEKAREENREEVREATHRLLKVLVPKFAHECKDHWTGNTLIKKLHDEGINIRHLGRVRKQLLIKTQKITEVSTQCNLQESWKKIINPPKDNSALTSILTEIVARTIKNEFRGKLREKINISRERVSVLPTGSPSRYCSVTIAQAMKRTFHSTEMDMVYRFLRPILFFKPQGPDTMNKVESFYIGNRPIPPMTRSFYFEVTVKVKERGLTGLVSSQSHLLPSLIDQNSYSLSNDGTIYVRGKPNFFIPDFKTTDSDKMTIGIFYCAKAQVINFIKDGKSLGLTIRRVEGTYIPALQDQHLISSNFGEKEFMFPLTSFCKGLNYPEPLFGPDGIEQEHKKFWTVSIKEQMKHRYPKALSKQESNPDFSLRDVINVSQMLDRLQVLTGIKLNSRILNDIRDGNKYIDLHEIDMLSLEPRVSYFHIIDFAEGVATLLQIINQRKGSVCDIQVEKDLLKDAEQKILSGSTLHAVPHYLYYSGNVFYQIAIRSDDEEKKIYLKKAKQQFKQNNYHRKELYQFSKLTSKHLRQYGKDLNEIYLRSLFMEGLIKLHKPGSGKFREAAKVLKKAYLSVGGNQLFFENIKRLKQDIEGCSYEDAKSIMIEAQALKEATCLAENDTPDYWFAVTYIIHKTISIITDHDDNCKEWPPVTKPLFKEVKENFDYLIKNHKSQVQSYIVHLFSGGMVGTDLAVLLELVPQIAGMSELLETASVGHRRHSLRDPHKNADVTRITQIQMTSVTNLVNKVLRTFQNNEEMTRQMPSFMSLLDATVKPLDQQDRLRTIEAMAVLFCDYQKDLIQLSKFRDILENEEIQLGGDLDRLFGSPALYLHAIAWQSKFEHILDSKSYICAGAIMDMIKVDEKILKEYARTQDRFDFLVSLRNNNQFQLRLKHEMPEAEFKRILDLPSQIHMKLNSNIYLVQLINQTPHDHLEYKPLLEVKHKLDGILESLQTAKYEFLEQRKVNLVSRKINLLPINGSQRLINFCILQGIKDSFSLRRMENRDFPKNVRQSLWRDLIAFLYTDHIIFAERPSIIIRTIDDLLEVEDKSINFSNGYQTHHIKEILDLSSKGLPDHYSMVISERHHIFKLSEPNPQWIKDLTASAEKSRSENRPTNSVKSPLGVFSSVFTSSPVSASRTPSRLSDVPDNIPPPLPTSKSPTRTSIYDTDLQNDVQPVPYRIRASQSASDFPSYDKKVVNVAPTKGLPRGQKRSPHISETLQFFPDLESSSSLSSPDGVQKREKEKEKEKEKEEQIEKKKTETGPFLWQWAKDEQLLTWYNYDPQTQKDIERAWEAGETEILLTQGFFCKDFTIVLRGQGVVHQRNNVTKFVHAVRRVPVTTLGGLAKWNGRMPHHRSRNDVTSSPNQENVFLTSSMISQKSNPRKRHPLTVPQPGLIPIRRASSYHLSDDTTKVPLSRTGTVPVRETPVPDAVLYSRVTSAPVIHNLQTPSDQDIGGRDSPPSHTGEGQLQTMEGGDEDVMVLRTSDRRAWTNVKSLPPDEGMGGGPTGGNVRKRTAPKEKIGLKKQPSEKGVYLIETKERGKV